MDSLALIHWQLQFTESFNHVVWRTLLREMTQERGGLAKSLILKDTKKAVILLFDVCICTITQRPLKSQLLLCNSRKMESYLSRIEKIFN